MELADLTAEEFVRILTEPEGSLVKQHAALLATDGVTVAFADDGVRQIAEIAYRVNQRTQNIGARRLYTVMEKLLEEVSFEAPDLGPEARHVTVDADYVRDKLKGALQDEDLAKYIL